MLDELNHLQKEILIFGTDRKRNRFRKLSSELSSLGFALIRRHDDSLGEMFGTYWEMRKKSDMGDRYAGGWITDEHEKNHNSECTTRAIYFCLNHEIPYQQIRELQNRTSRMFFSSGRFRGWNSMKTVRKILEAHGFDRVEIPPRRFYSGVIALKLKELDTKVILKSSGHLSACYRGAVVDDWDSRKKKVEEIYVKSDMVDKVKYSLGI